MNAIGSHQHITSDSEFLARLTLLEPCSHTISRSTTTTIAGRFAPRPHPGARAPLQQNAMAACPMKENCGVSKPASVPRNSRHTIWPNRLA